MTTKPTYYNEWDEETADWLRKLIAAGLIPAGDVDTRSIEDVSADDLVGYGQCHFFAGIGGWSLGFRLAGIPDDFPGWSASVPCPDYSVASNAHGGAQGQAGSRHLWPHVRRLAAQRHPPIIFGEQVASAVGWGWLDEVGLDVESEGYAFGAAVLRADAGGADHERRRIYWVAHASGEGREGLEQVRRVPIAARTAYAQLGEPFAEFRRVLAGDFSRLLPSHGVPIKVERSALKGYGNAIVPEVARLFIEAVMEES